MSERGRLWISESEVLSLMDMPKAIRAVTRSLALEAANKAVNMKKAHASWGGGATLHAVGASLPEVGFAGTKTWVHTPLGATPIFALFNSHSGALLAIIDAFALGQFRTGAVSAIATDLLSRKDAADFAIIGTGKQAMTQVRAALAVRPIREIRVFGRDNDRCQQFAARIQEESGVKSVASKTIDEAVKNASIITTVTRATEPFLDSSVVASGAHINAVGAIVPGRYELSPGILGRATMIVTDSIAQARELSSEMIDFMGAEDARWARVRSLASVVKSEQTRPESADLTIFKSLGIGLSDLALAIEVYKQAVPNGLGQSSKRSDEISADLAVRRQLA